MNAGRGRTVAGAGPRPLPPRPSDTPTQYGAEGSAPPAIGETTPRVSGGPRSIVPGAVLGGRYRLRRLLGTGGMGEAWEAEHVVIRKIVAIKLLRASAWQTTDARPDQLLREARAAATIHHPNIVDVTDFGETDDGSAFVVMEFLDGETIGATIEREGSLLWERVRGILLQLTDALQAAHSKGVIHRDLKPENVFLIESGGTRDVCKIIDFGIAKLTLLDTAATSFTRTGMVCGTPAFMSPEQARGEPIDARTDVYALGCLAYRMLTGELPFAGENATEVLFKQLFVEPVSMSAIAPHAIVPAEIEAIVRKAMRKDRNLRFSSMAEFHEALSNVGSGRGVVDVRVEVLPAPPVGAQMSFAGGVRSGAQERASAAASVAAGVVAASGGAFGSPIGEPASTPFGPPVPPPGRERHSTLRPIAIGGIVAFAVLAAGAFWQRERIVAAFGEGREVELDPSGAAAADANAAGTHPPAADHGAGASSPPTVASPTVVVPVPDAEVDPIDAQAPAISAAPEVGERPVGEDARGNGGKRTTAGRRGDDLPAAATPAAAGPANADEPAQAEPTADAPAQPSAAAEPEPDPAPQPETKPEPPPAPEPARAERVHDADLYNPWD